MKKILTFCQNQSYTLYIRKNGGIQMKKTYAESLMTVHTHTHRAFNEKINNFANATNIIELKRLII